MQQNQIRSGRRKTFLSDKIKNALVEQLANEAYNRDTYIVYASMIKGLGYNGSFAWFKAQAAEESRHWTAIQEFLEAAGITLNKFPATQPIEVEFTTIRQFYEAALDLEIQTTEYLQKIAELCLAEGEHISFKFIQDLLYNQLEEEDEARDRLEILSNTPDSLIADQIIGSLTE